MIRKLQLKFVAVCMTLVMVVLGAVLVSIFLSARQNLEVLSHQVLQRVIREDTSHGTMPSQQPDLGLDIGGKEVVLPYFTVVLWEDRSGNYTAYVTGGTYSNLQGTEELSTVLQECLTQKQEEGTLRTYNLRYLRQDNGLFQKIAFVDTSMQQATLQEMMSSHIQIAVAAFFLLLAISIALARWATAPVEKAWRQQRQFLSDASHELKTPLTVILSNAELLQAAPLSDKPARWSENIRMEAQQMKNLVEEMLTLTRADNMPHTAVLEEVSLSDIAADCALAFEPVAFEAGKPLDYHLAEDVTVLGDRDKLRQLVSVLLDNAIKYGQDGGTITLTLQKTDRHARLIVTNPGEPIPPEQLKRLFERFYRADASRGEKSGFGLGLPIANTIAAEHKGTLKAESDAASTRFLFTIPLKK